MKRRNLIDLDKFRLDEEWVDQDKLVEEWGEKLALAKKEVAEMEAKLELREAKLERSIRRSPEDYGIKKVTEAIIKATVIVQESYQISKRRLINAKYERDSIQAVCNALEHRKKAIEDLVVLHNQSYFAKPKIKEGVTNRDMRKAVGRRVTSRLPQPEVN